MSQKLLFICFLTQFLAVRTEDYWEDFKGHSIYLIPSMIDADGLCRRGFQFDAQGDKECYPTAYHWLTGPVVPEKVDDGKINPLDFEAALKSPCIKSFEKFRQKNSFFLAEFKGAFGNGEGEYKKNYVVFNKSSILCRGSTDNYLQWENAIDEDEGGENEYKIIFYNITDDVRITYQVVVLLKLNSTHCKCDTWRWEFDVKISEYIERKAIVLTPKIPDQLQNIMIRFEGRCALDGDTEKPYMGGIYCNCTLPTKEEKHLYFCDALGRKICSPPYTGLNCSDDVNECEDPYYCSNGDCTNFHGGFNCTCYEGYHGDRCQFAKMVNFTLAQTESCAQRPTLCKNGAKCVVKGNSSECACTANFRGKYCHIRRDLNPWLMQKAIEWYKDFFVKNPIRGGLMVGAISVLLLCFAGIAAYFEFSNNQNA